MPHATMPSTGFQAIILCGPGESLNPFNSNPAEFPKALIPIANRPMVWYPLDWCYRMGVTNITLVTPYECRSALHAALSQNPHLTSLPSPRPNVIAPEGLTLTTGTAELFRFGAVQDSIVEDFIVLPCDLLCEQNGSHFLETWMTHLGGLDSPSASGLERTAGMASRMGGMGIWYQTRDSSEDAIGVKKEETDFVAFTALPPPAAQPPKGSLRPYLYNVAMAMPKAALEDDLEERQSFAVRHALLRRHGKVKLEMTHRDAHVYFFPYWVKALMKRNESFDSIGEDLIGSWAKAGWQAGLAEKLGMHETLARGQRSESIGQSHVGMKSSVRTLSSTFTQRETVSEDERKRRNDKFSFASRVHDAPPASNLRGSQSGVPPITAYCHPSQPSSSMLRRVDTVALLLSASLSLAKLLSVAEANAAGVKPSPFAHQQKIPTTTSLPPQLTIDQHSVLIDANVTLTSKSTIRESVVGANCILGTPGATGPGVRLNRCLLMEGAVVESGSTLNGCALGRRCKISADCDLRDCYVQEGYVVPQGTMAKGEVFAGFDEDVGDAEEALQMQDDSGVGESGVSD